jgi:hypothetical protein
MHITLRERYEVMGGRRFRIREYEDSQIEFMRFKAWTLGFFVGAAVAALAFSVPILIR